MSKEPTNLNGKPLKKKSPLRKQIEEARKVTQRKVVGGGLPGHGKRK
ncbi:hypothetical protein [Rhodococcus opacus]|nr:hypothetical protein [Rhodococcus opacus]UNN05235.1 hypothetical protein MOO23_40165 [Rhodococcus opacus]